MANYAKKSDKTLLDWVRPPPLWSKKSEYFLITFFCFGRDPPAPLLTESQKIPVFLLMPPLTDQHNFIIMISTITMFYRYDFNIPWSPQFVPGVQNPPYFDPPHHSLDCCKQGTHFAKISKPICLPIYDHWHCCEMH